MIYFTISHPPSVNHYWKRGQRGRLYLSEEAKVFRAITKFIVRAKRIKKFEKKPLHLVIWWFPPDRRTRDSDNILKAIFDSLEHAGVYKNDSQIKHHEVKFCEPRKPGRIVVGIEEIERIDFSEIMEYVDDEVLLALLSRLDRTGNRMPALRMQVRPSDKARRHPKGN